jgi:hypothetical protein
MKNRYSGPQIVAKLRGGADILLGQDQNLNRLYTKC